MFANIIIDINQIVTLHPKIHILVSCSIYHLFIWFDKPLTPKLAIDNKKHTNERKKKFPTLISIVQLKSAYEIPIMKQVKDKPTNNIPA